ncbi:protein arginine N-methyltransferase 5-like isoform X3 [Montipora foliosa]|uniref:protein arginine N-methyltransferase 5-like isoform X3 n=1 Tax=Montipora foliosa TaxID=591990 RepID=UPI0035F181CB
MVEHRVSCGRDFFCVPDLAAVLRNATSGGYEGISCTKACVQAQGKYPEPIERFDFICVPICHPRYRREFLDPVPNRTGAFTRSDLVLSSQDWNSLIVGKISPWLDLDSTNETVRKNSELALHQELCYSVHLGLPAVLVPLKSYNCVNLAHHINTSIHDMHVQQVWVHVPMKSPEDECDKHLFQEEEDVQTSKCKNDPWEWWNLFRTICANSRKIGLALEISVELPSEEELERWFGEPVKAAILPTSLFLTNRKAGFAVLPRAHQALIKRLFRLNTQLILTGVNKHKDKGVGLYYKYLAHLYQTQPELDNVSQFAKGYEDYLQCPLQPLMDNLESQTYEIFERDPIKYGQYQKAVHQALIDRVPEEKKDSVVTVIMVVGAGRGPLVRASLTAGEESGRKVRVYAVEKNFNAVVTLETLKEEEWNGDVTVVSSDMREWDAPEKADILVSELLGSFGDNELSPECLDGAQRFLKEDGISIPCEYTSFLAPISAPKLHYEVSQSSDTGKGPLAPFETPYVVRLHNVTVISPPQPCFSFEHPNRADRIDNSRVRSLEFEAKTSFSLHGFAGYFETVLYKDVTLSIKPDTHSEGMFSWFPFYFPVKEPQYVTAGSTITCHFWRKCTPKKVWYEWCMSKPSPVPLHNPGGRSYVIGL